jgi:hypothetical protein
MGSKEEAVHDFVTEPGLVSGTFWALSGVRSPLDIVICGFLASWLRLGILYQEVVPQSRDL